MVYTRIRAGESLKTGPVQIRFTRAECGEIDVGISDGGETIEIVASEEEESESIFDSRLDQSEVATVNLRIVPMAAIG